MTNLSMPINLKKTPVIVLLVSTLFFSSSLFAVDPMSPISGGMGGAGIAGVAPQDVMLNPGTIPHSKGYHIAAGTLHYKFTPDNSSGLFDENNAYKIAISDNQPGTTLPAGLTYIKQDGYYADAEEIHLSLGKFLAPQLTMGIDLTRMEEKRKVGYSANPAELGTFTDWDFSLGFVYTPQENLGLGAVFYNVLDSDIDDLRSAFGIGVHYLYMNFVNARLDLIFPFKKSDGEFVDVKTGFESQIMKDTFLRLGYIFEDGPNYAYWTTGLGWNGPKIGVDYSYKDNIDLSGDAQHMVQVRVFF